MYNLHQLWTISADSLKITDSKAWFCNQASLIVVVLPLTFSLRITWTPNEKCCRLQFQSQAVIFLFKFKLASFCDVKTSLGRDVHTNVLVFQAWCIIFLACTALELLHHLNGCNVVNLIFVFCQAAISTIIITINLFFLSIIAVSREQINCIVFLRFCESDNINALNQCLTVILWIIPYAFTALKWKR